MADEALQGNHHEYSWQAADGLKLYGQDWLPEGKPQAIISIVHGFKDHSSRFDGWARRLTVEGFGVMSVDLRGHGHSAGRRGYARRYTAYLDDVEVLCQHAADLWPDLPQILYGHSLGGNIVINYLLSQRPQPRAAVITSPWFTLAEKPSWLMTLFARTLQILPGVVVPSDLDAEGLSRNSAVVKAYMNDPLVHNRISPRLFFEIEKYGLFASHSIFKLNLPLLVMHGDADPVTSLRKTRSFVLNAGHMTTYKEWPGCRHELHNDLDADQVFRFLVDWIHNLIAA